MGATLMAIALSSSLRETRIDLSILEEVKWGF